MGWPATPEIDAAIERMLRAGTTNAEIARRLGWTAPKTHSKIHGLRRKDPTLPRSTGTPGWARLPDQQLKSPRRGR